MLINFLFSSSFPSFRFALKLILIAFLINNAVSFDDSQCTFYRHQKPLERKNFLVCVVDFQLPDHIRNVSRQPYEEIKGLIIGGADQISEPRTFEYFRAVTHYGLLEHTIETVTRENFNFSAAFHLEGLDISKGKLERIEQDAFQDLIQLVDVDLSKNRIDYIHPQTFSILSNLEKLSLNDNNLIAVEMDTFNSNRKLNYLNLRNNKFAFIAPQAFEGLYGLRELYFAGNACITNDYKPPRVPTLRLIFTQQCRETPAIADLLSDRRLDFEADYE